MIPLKQITIHVVISSSGSLTIIHHKEDSEGSIEKWVANGPQNLKIVLDSSWYSAQAFTENFYWLPGLDGTHSHVPCLKL